MNKEERLKHLTESPNSLIPIEDVALLLGYSISNCRKYKDMGIIEPVTFDKQRHLYELNEIKHIKRKLPKLKMKRKLSEIGHVFRQHRNTQRQKHPKR